MNWFNKKFRKSCSGTLHKISLENLTEVKKTKKYYHFFQAFQESKLHEKGMITEIHDNYWSFHCRRLLFSQKYLVYLVLRLREIVREKIRGSSVIAP